MDINGQLNGKDRVEIAAFDRSTNTDDTIRYPPHFMFDSLLSLILSCNLYPETRNGLNSFSTFRRAVSFRKRSKTCQRRW